MSTTRSKGHPARDLLEEAVFLLRTAPAGAWLGYGLGVLPFAIGLLFFWADMSRNAWAAQHASAAALGLALLFVWMKCAQAWFAVRLTSHLTGEAPPAWRPAQRVRLLFRQAAWQPTALVLVPLAALLVLPFGRTYAFYQNLTVIEHPDPGPLRRRSREAWQLARLWPKQNHLIILILGLLAVVVLLNVVTVMAWGPRLFKSLTGIETPFSRSGYSYANSTFLMVCFTLSAMVMDPLVKSVYLLRCFYGRAIHTGMDLRLRLRLRVPVALLAVLLWCPVAARAQAAPPAVDGQQLDHALDKVLAQPEYRWRMPPAPRDRTLKTGWIKSFFDWLRDKLDGLNRWLSRDRPRENTRGSTNWNALLESLLYITAALLAGAALYSLARHLIARRRASLPGHRAVPLNSQPDLARDEVTADLMSRDGWLGLVEECLRNGQYRLALRACFLAQLAQLADCGLIAIARFKTNRDYETELRRHAHVHTGLCAAFHDRRLLFERVWYGNTAADAALVEIFRSCLTTAESENA